MWVRELLTRALSRPYACLGIIISILVTCTCFFALPSEVISVSESGWVAFSNTSSIIQVSIEFVGRRALSYTLVVDEIHEFVIGAGLHACSIVSFSEKAIRASCHTSACSWVGEEAIGTIIPALAACGSASC